MQEQALIQRCIQGDRESFATLYRRHQGQVRATLYGLCGSTALDDLVQEVFLRVWQGLPRFRQRSSFSTWLYRITWNVASDQRQRWAKDRSREAEPTVFPTTLPTTNALQTLHYQTLVQAGLQCLSLEHRAVVVLHDLEDLPQQEVAHLLGIPVGTVKSRLFHARASLKAYFLEHGVEL